MTIRKMRRKRTLATREQFQNRVSQLFMLLGCQQPFVDVEYLEEDSILASAVGVTVLSYPFGKIRVARKLLELLTDAEIEFVLAHEVAHIHLNHVVSTASFAVARELANEVAKHDAQWKTIIKLWDSFMLLRYGKGTLPPSAVVTKKQELDADTWAVFLTGNKLTACSALLKLVGNNPNAPSHTWEVFDKPLPVMTIRERMAALKSSCRLA